jgi:hypothetical protein
MWITKVLQMMQKAQEEEQLRRAKAGKPVRRKQIKVLEHDHCDQTYPPVDSTSAEEAESGRAADGRHYAP